MESTLQHLGDVLLGQPEPALISLHSSSITQNHVAGLCTSLYLGIPPCDFLFCWCSGICKFNTVLLMSDMTEAIRIIGL